MNYLKNSMYLILISYLFSQPDVLDANPQSFQQEEYPDHISLIIHEDLLNTFFSSMGEIRGEGDDSVIKYSWFLLDPRIEIEKGHATFHAKIRAKTKNFRITRDVIGSVSVTFDKESNLLDVKVDKADVVLDVDVLGKNFVLGHLDIAKHFTKSLKLNGPQSIEEEVEFKLPNGKKRIMQVDVVSYNLELIKDAIIVSTSLGFKRKEDIVTD